MTQNQIPESLTLEFLNHDMSPVKLASLGHAFLKIFGSGVGSLDRAFRIAIEGKQSKAGNTYYSYSQNGIPLPNGLDTHLKIDGVMIPSGHGPSFQNQK